MKLIWIIVFFLFLIFVFIGFKNEDFGNGEFERSWTTAICDGNRCRDFEVTCLGDRVLDMKPITGFIVFSTDFEDKRKESALCG